MRNQFLYGCKTWTLIKTLIKQLDGTYTRILQMIQVHWSQKVKQRYSRVAIERVSTKIRRRILKFAGHCLRSRFWEPTHGTRRRRRQLESYIRTLERDTDIQASERDESSYDEP